MATPTYPIPESYFLRFVSPSNYNTRNSFQATGAPRASDASVYFKQYPLGWLFFSVHHVNELLKLARTFTPSLTLEELAPEMVRVWDIMARDTYMDPGDQSNLSRGLAMLDTTLLERVHDTATRNAIGQQYYRNYINQPYQATPVPTNQSNTNRSLRVADTQGNLQGGAFDTSATSAKVPKYTYPGPQDVIKYA